MAAHHAAHQGSISGQHTIQHTRAAYTAVICCCGVLPWYAALVCCHGTRAAYDGIRLSTPVVPTSTSASVDELAATAAMRLAAHSVSPNNLAGGLHVNVVVIGAAGISKAAATSSAVDELAQSCSIQHNIPQ